MTAPISSTQARSPLTRVRALSFAAIAFVLSIIATGFAQPQSKLELAAPIDRWDEAIPLGNGLLGGLLWGGGGTIKLSLDRGDLWDNRLPDALKADDWTYATIQRLVAAGDQPTLNRMFDEPYEAFAYPTKLPGGRLELELGSGAPSSTLKSSIPKSAMFSLNLARAEATVTFDSPDAPLSITAFFSAVEPVGMMRLQGGSRALAPALKLVRPAGLDKLNYAPSRPGSYAAEDCSAPGSIFQTWFEQDAADGLRYALVAGTRSLESETIIAVTIASTRDGPDPLGIARRRVAAALNTGYDAMLVSHLRWWKKFWTISSVKIPDAKLQRQYDLCKYFAGSASRRGAAPMPLQGVWTADDGNLPPWKGDFHNDLNTQMTYLALHAAGLEESALSWIDFNWELLPKYRAFAKKFYEIDGAVVPGVMTLDGSATGGWGQYSLSPTNGAWVAQSFYLHWRHTVDEKFLREKAYPFCAQIGRALELLLKPDAQGLLKLPLSSSPEIFDNSLRAWLKPNSNYDQALMKWLFEALAEMSTAMNQPADAERWSKLSIRVGDFEYDPPGVLAFSRGEPFNDSHRHFSNLMAIHPLGTLNIEQSEAQRAAVNSSIDRVLSKGTSVWCGYSFSWMSCLLARAGRGDEALDYLSKFNNAFTLRNGFHCNGDQSGTGLSSLTYRPFTLEGNFLAMQAVQEMLLQSWGGRVRIFPTLPAAWSDVSFENLRAEGGFVVSAQRWGGKVLSVRIIATQDATLRLDVPGGQGRYTWNVPSNGASGALVVPLTAGMAVEGVARE